MFGWEHPKETRNGTDHNPLLASRPLLARGEGWNEGNNERNARENEQWIFICKLFMSRVKIGYYWWKHFIQVHSWTNNESQILFRNNYLQEQREQKRRDHRPCKSVWYYRIYILGNHLFFSCTFFSMNVERVFEMQKRFHQFRINFLIAYQPLWSRSWSWASWERDLSTMTMVPCWILNRCVIVRRWNSSIHLVCDLALARNC